jgi:glycosyltransferase involved in cell wall biosynthesis
LEFTAVSDVLVLPSLIESCPLVAMEAQVLGKPVVATRVGGMSEVVNDGKNDLLVPPRDSRLLADAIIAVISGPPLARSLGDHARALVGSQFSANEMVKGVQSLYGELADVKGIAR